MLCVLLKVLTLFLLLLSQILFCGFLDPSAQADGDWEIPSCSRLPLSFRVLSFYFSYAFCWGHAVPSGDRLQSPVEPLPSGSECSLGTRMRSDFLQLLSMSWTLQSQSHRGAHSPPPLPRGATDLQLFHQTLCQPGRQRDASVGFRPLTRQVPRRAGAVPALASGLRPLSGQLNRWSLLPELQGHAISTGCHAHPASPRNTTE